MTQQTTPAAPAASPAVTAPAAPAPGTPEHAAAMVALYEAQGKESTEVPPPADAPKVDAPATPEGEQKPAEPKTEEAPKDPSWTDFADVSTHLTDAGEFKPESLAALTKLGLPEDVSKALQGTFQELRTLRAEKAAAETAKQATALHAAAGGQAEFQALVDWGKTNLTPAERQHFDEQLNGPFAAQAVELLKIKRGPVQARAGDPVLHTGNSGDSSGLRAFKDSSEQQAAFADPRYRTSEAYRRQVAQRLALTR